MQRWRGLLSEHSTLQILSMKGTPFLVCRVFTGLCWNKRNLFMVYTFQWKWWSRENLYLLPLPGSAVTSHAVADNKWALHTEAPVLAHQVHAAARGSARCNTGLQHTRLGPLLLRGGLYICDAQRFLGRGCYNSYDIYEWKKIGNNILKTVRKQKWM